ncbi:signal transduction histidine kinase [Catenuloplanes nepalensis]|uniref:histidine kinase n=1 Tax=Catenuloplanes nepalensis TaxID=587533 RepID=A0ABT9MJN2_9ACTN|nr:histidine kinase [Catenuloplanes nepalensis]MDP9791634.1 signal transduction histidine kinase [Catenuloplanes nepalensis]
MRKKLIQDGALGVAAVAFGLLIWLSDRGSPPGTAVLTLMIAQTLLLCLRRVSPVTCVALMLVLQTAISAAAPHGTGLRGAGLAIAVFTCGTLLTARAAITIAVITAVVEIGGYAVLTLPPVEDPAWELSRLVVNLALALLLYVAAALLGAHLTMRRRYAEAVAARADAETARANAVAARAEAETARANAVAARAEADAEAHRARTEAVLTAERARTARDLHDVAAHHLTSLIVQATLVERLLDRDPEAARGHAAAVREEGRNTLHNLRRIVGALRADDGAGPHLPDGSGLAMIDRLVSGGEATLTVDGTPGVQDPAVEVALHRVAQEALSNARDHAPGAPVSITLAYGETETTMEIHNGRATGSVPVRDDRRHRGFGLIGMRERASLIGGALDAGPADDGGWLVRLTVPRTGAGSGSGS